MLKFTNRWPGTTLLFYAHKVISITKKVMIKMHISVELCVISRNTKYRGGLKNAADIQRRTQFLYFP